MRVLIAHHSAIQGNRLAKALDGRGAIRVAHIALDLSQTYDFSEHHVPDTVLLDEDLANCPEFELLSSLFKIIGTNCIILGSGSDRPFVRTQANAPRHVMHLPPTVTEEEILDAVQSGTRPTPRHHAAPVQSVDQIDAARLVLIGSSTGGVDALLKVIKHFSTNCPPTLIVQHTGGQFAQGLIRLLDKGTTAAVQPARHRMQPQPGHIYLAPDSHAHLTLAAGPIPKVALDQSDAMSGHRPSVDALFNSALPIAAKCTAALLTGMGRDGAEGITALRTAGAVTLGQDEATSVVYGMPRVAHELGGIAQQLPIDDIGPAILRASRMKARV